KTGALIVGAVKAGAILGGSRKEELDALTKYGKKIGLAFQITDDILDVEGSKKILGKETGMDSVQGKATYPQIFGLQESRKRAETLVEKAEQALDRFDHHNAEPLKLIARHICQRIR
ncbi:MAG: polyprenyl synthetase family protein, partial [Acidobacteriota bacterium]|nr:polyprenyl synthetase family protein [Acidobacteriota bacterium]